ncbi:Halomucin [Frankliniella fusca]|uniref:Halomucin n=1 Tax=Frankliniella fusca TaxID=407009 RepID=A0AAE1HG73_9NEOP|nr:Halomucin [Frankliniella fusca]
MSSSDDDDDLLDRRSRATKYRRLGPKRNRLPYPDDDLDNNGPDRHQHLEVDQDGQAGADIELGVGQDSEHESEHESSDGTSSAYAETQSGSESDWSDALSHENSLEEEDGNEDNLFEQEEEEDFMIDQNLDLQDSDEEDHTDNEDDNDDMNIEGQNFNFDLDSLDHELNFLKARTIRESLYLELALSIRHKQTYENLIDSIKAKNVLYSSKVLSTSKKELWKALGRSNSGLQFHAYCSDCGAYINRKCMLVVNAVCPDCGESKPISKASYFVTLSIRKQLEYFLSIPEVAKHLRYRENRVKILEDAYEDILDGEEYKNITIDGQKLLGSNNFTYSFSIDGCKPSKGSKTNIYPLFLRINELPPEMRQKYMFLAACYVDIKEPNVTQHYSILL